MMAQEIRFLSIEDVLLLQENTLAHEGGLAGVKDYGLLDSAVNMPRQQFGGQYLHDGIAAMAAAYLFHLAKNHAFNDGNKRVGTLAALTFLRENGCELKVRPDELERVVLTVADSSMNKTALSEWFSSQIEP